MNHLWQSSLFAGAVWLLTLLLRKNPARVRYWLWFAASVKFLIPFSLFVAAGSHVHLRTAAIPTQIPIVFEQIVEPLPGPIHIAATPAVAFDPLPILIGIWAFGFLTVAFRWSREWLRMRAVLRHATPLHLNLNLPVPAMSASELIEPGIFGLFRPVLLLPEGIANHLSAEELRAILIHELHHVRRRDNLFASIHMATEALFWFHPLLWWIGHRLVEERERACDEEVLRQGSEPEAYAEGILKVCERYLESPLSCVAGVSGADLKKRIEGIMTNRIVEKLTGSKRLLLAGAGVLAVVTPVVLGVVNAPALRAQAAAAATPKWEAVSVRPSKDCSAGPVGTMPSPGRLEAKCMPLESFINSAYVWFANGRQNALRSAPILGAPDWINSDLYEINAKAEGAPSQQMMRGPMMQALLEDRFKLKIRRETRQVPVYALTVAKNGPKLTPFQEGSCVRIDFNNIAPQPQGQKPYCRPGWIRPKGNDRGGLMIDAEAMSLDEFGKFLGLSADRPVVDQTGISGLFDFHLEFTPDETTPRFNRTSGAAQADPTGGAPFLREAIQEQFGLRLDPTKGPGEFLVVDHVERPSAN